jgi:FAD synthetase
MTRVMAAGVFDILHAGHVHYLEEARSHGDELVAVVATDVSARDRKRPPILPQHLRVRLVEALDAVDRARVGHESDHFRTVEEVDPDVIALGYDDHHEQDEVREQLEQRGLDHVDVVRCSRFDGDLVSTGEIVGRVLELARAGRLPEAETEVPREGGP